MDIEQISADGIPLNLVDTQARTDITEIKSNLTDLQVYSTTEKVIGTWIDGKPIYRRVFSGNCTASGNVVVLQSSDIDFVVHGYGCAKSNYNRAWNIPNTFVTDSGYDNRWALNTSNGQIYIGFSSAYRTTDKFVFVIEYTKTTD